MTISIQEYADVISWIMQERGYTVGDKDNFEADITLNLPASMSIILIGSIRNDRSYCSIECLDQVIRIGMDKFHLADPDSCRKIGDCIEALIKSEQFVLTYSYENH